MIVKILGFAAATLTTFAFLPQALKTWKTKSTRDISFWMFSLLFAGLLLWTTYGILIKNYPIIAANATTLLFAGVILFYKINPQKTFNIAHVSICVNNLEAMKNFYTTAFNGKAGTRYENKDKQFSSYFISFSNGAKLELMNNMNKDSLINNNHIAFSTGSRKNVDAFSSFLVLNGAILVSEPRTTGDGYYESVLKDPEGNLIEITV